MSLQKFKTTVFIPKLTDISSIVEIDVDPNDSETVVSQKIVNKIVILDSNLGLLLSKKSFLANVDWRKLISYERISKSRFSHRQYQPIAMNTHR